MRLRRSQSNLIPVLVLVWLAWIARLRGLDGYSIWLDEALEIGRAASPLPVVLRSRLVDIDPPLFPAFLHFWLHAGANDFLVRFPTAALGLLGVVLVYAWLRRHGPATLALLGAGIFALAPVQVHYAQEVNQYALVGPLAAGALLAFDRALDSNRWRDQAAFMFVSAAGLYTYYGLAWLILALDLYWLLKILRVLRVSWLRFLAYQGAMALCALSLLPFSLEGHVLRGLAAWKGQYAQLARGDVLQQFLGGLHGHLMVFATLPFSRPPDALVAPLYLLLALGLVTVARRQLWAGGRLVFPLVVGPLLAFLASGYGLYPFQGRHLLFAAPFLYGLLATGLFSLHGVRPLFVAACAGIAALWVAFWTVPLVPGNPWLQVTSREELRPILVRVSAARMPGDGVYVYYGAAPAYAYYHMAGLAPEADVVQEGWPAGEMEEQVAGARRAADGRQRLWLIFAHIHGDEDQAIVDQLAKAGFVPTEQFVATNANAYLLVRPLTTAHQ